MSESNQAQTGFRFGVIRIVRKVRERQRLVNIILALAGISIILILYTTCRGSCTYSQGSFAGIDLKYLGITYMGLIILFNLLRRDALNLLLLVLGMGAEIYLIGYQIINGVYCPYCLMFAAVVIVLFTFNFEKSKKAIIVVFLILGFFLLFAWFRGTPTPSYAADTIMPFFGKGKIEVRLYTDYFCNPCASIEPKLEPIISELVGKNVIAIAFIDTPLHKQTSLYIRYFLYILNEGNDFNRALLARKVLFEAARKNITEKEKIEDLLRERNVKFKPFDPKPTFDIFSRYLAEDGITSTPTLVIRQDGGKKKFCGTSNVLTAIEGLKRR